MKQTLLFVFCLTAFTVSYAQKKVVIADTLYTSTDNGVTLNRIQVRQLRYNENCLNNAIDISAYIPNSDLVTQKGYDSIEYYQDGSMHRSLHQIWNSEMNVYENSTRVTYNHYNSGSATSQINEVWVGNEWRMQAFDSGRYDAKGNRYYDLVRGYDPKADTLYYGIQSINIYDSANHLASNTQENYDKATQTFIPNSLTLYTHDTSGYLVKSSYKLWDIASASWSEISVTNYYNNRKGTTDSSIEVTPARNSVMKWYYTYDANTSSLFQSTNYHFVNNKLSDGSRNTYYHVDNSFEHLDSTIQEDLNLSESDSFAIWFIKVYQVNYNNDSTIHDTRNSTSYPQQSYSFYSRLFYTYGPCTSVLPVSLLSFTGAQNNNSAQLQWQATNEINVSSFGVMRSTDGIHFSNIGNIIASGDNAGTKNYTYTDVNVSSFGASELYYKLAIADEDGTITYSKIVRLDIATNQFNIVLSPNPVTNTISVYSPVTMSNALVKINDMSGKILYTSRHNILAGSKLNIDVSAFAKGVYIVTVQSASNKFAYKIVK